MDKAIEYIMAGCIVILAVLLTVMVSVIVVSAAYGLYNVGIIADVLWVLGGMAFWGAIVFTRRLIVKNNWL